jgi:hypothetical protein
MPFSSSKVSYGPQFSNFLWRSGSIVASRCTIQRYTHDYAEYTELPRCSRTFRYHPKIVETTSNTLYNIMDTSWIFRARTIFGATFLIISIHIRCRGLLSVWSYGFGYMRTCSKHLLIQWMIAGTWLPKHPPHVSYNSFIMWTSCITFDNRRIAYRCFIYPEVELLCFFVTRHVLYWVHIIGVPLT